MTPEQPGAGEDLAAPREDSVPDAATIAAWTPDQRDRVAGLLAAVNVPAPVGRTPTPRPLLVTVAVVGVLVLVPWIAYLTATLPSTATTRAWRVAWVGFDTGLVVALGMLGWLAYQRRQLVIVASAVSSALLVVDAWFDVTFSWGTEGQTWSIIAAGVIEVPLAAFLMVATLRMLRRMIATAAALRGDRVDEFSLWRAPAVMRGSPPDETSHRSE